MNHTLGPFPEMRRDDLGRNRERRVRLSKNPVLKVSFHPDKTIRLVSYEQFHEREDFFFSGL